MAPEPIVDRAIVDSLLSQTVEKPITGKTIQDNNIIVIKEPDVIPDVPRQAEEILNEFESLEEELKEVIPATIPEP